MTAKKIKPAVAKKKEIKIPENIDAIIEQMRQLGDKHSQGGYNYAQYMLNREGVLANFAITKETYEYSLTQRMKEARGNEK